MILEIKKKYSIVNIGHAGTLDPLAQGILPIAVGKATKLISESKIPNKIILNKIPNMSKRDLMKLLTRFTNERGIL